MMIPGMMMISMVIETWFGTLRLVAVLGVVRCQFKRSVTGEGSPDCITYIFEIRIRTRSGHPYTLEGQHNYLLFRGL